MRVRCVRHSPTRGMQVVYQHHERAAASLAPSGAPCRVRFVGGHTDWELVVLALRDPCPAAFPTRRLPLVEEEEEDVHGPVLYLSTDAGGAPQDVCPEAVAHLLAWQDSVDNAQAPRDEVGVVGGLEGKGRVDEGFVEAAMTEDGHGDKGG